MNQKTIRILLYKLQGRIFQGQIYKYFYETNKHLEEMKETLLYLIFKTIHCQSLNTWRYFIAVYMYFVHACLPDDMYEQ